MLHPYYQTGLFNLFLVSLLPFPVTVQTIQTCSVVFTYSSIEVPVFEKFLVRSLPKVNHVFLVLLLTFPFLLSKFNNTHATKDITSFFAEVITLSRSINRLCLGWNRGNKDLDGVSSFFIWIFLDCIINRRKVY